MVEMQDVYKTLKEVGKDAISYFRTRDFREVLPFVDALVEDNIITNADRVQIEFSLKKLMKAIMSLVAEYTDLENYLIELISLVGAGEPMVLEVAGRGWTEVKLNQLWNSTPDIKKKELHDLYESTHHPLWNEIIQDLKEINIIVKQGGRSWKNVVDFLAESKKLRSKQDVSMFENIKALLRDGLLLYDNSIYDDDLNEKWRNY